jgi:hypothetical protein
LSEQFIQVSIFVNIEPTFLFKGQMDVESEDSALAGPNSSLLSELTANDRTVHADFYRDFGDLFDDNDLN